MKIFKEKNKWIWQSFDKPIFYYKKVDLSSIYYKLGQLNTSLEFINEDNFNELYLDILSKEINCISKIQNKQLEDTNINETIIKVLNLKSKNLNKSSTYDESLIKTVFKTKNNKDNVLTKEILISWHKAIFSNDNSTKYNENYRIDKEAVEIVSYVNNKEKIHFIAPQYNDVETHMKEFLKWLNSETKIDLIYKAAIANLWFMMIHPFDDGNGRVARFISYFILSQSDLTNSDLLFLSSILDLKRDEYYEVLDKICMQTDLDINLWIQWFVKIINESLNDIINKVELIKTKTIFLNKHNNKDLNERQKTIISLMLSSLPNTYKGGMKVNKYVGIVNTTRITASRDLADLVSKNIMKSNAKGRNVYYTLNL